MQPITARLVGEIIDRQGAKREHLIPILDRWGKRKTTGRINVLSCEGEAALETRLALDLAGVDYVRLAIPGGLTTFIVEDKVPETAARWATQTPIFPMMGVGLVLMLINDRGAVLSLSDGFCRGSSEPLNWSK